MLALKEDCWDHEGHYNIVTGWCDARSILDYPAATNAFITKPAVTRFLIYDGIVPTTNAFYCPDDATTATDSDTDVSRWYSLAPHVGKPVCVANPDGVTLVDALRALSRQ